MSILCIGLLIGALGQSFFYKQAFDQIPSFLIHCVLGLPWFTILAIHFTHVGPFGAKGTRRAYLLVMVWYAVVTIAAELLNLRGLIQPQVGNSTIIVARSLMYFGFLSYIPLIYGYVYLGKKPGAGGTTENAHQLDQVESKVS